MDKIKVLKMQVYFETMKTHLFYWYGDIVFFYI